ncbi:DNA polymerase Y family protein [Cognatishimia sp. F0-27]|uniref:Y-family DNA polymerase n=1 Tax=Cognatishimia sp. F0-27 TaxID=2816855 RepID=UPI001D0C6AD3|nr:DNA polymerase Y family protein [Cognatishimia sp. F0-27]MCC1491269.1 DNA polymerase Y family protein [Cognatishimia sp. F0-27]
MPHRRILSLWFPRLGAERLIRIDPLLGERPFAVVDSDGPAQTLSSLSRAASAAGLTLGQPLRDAHALCADLVTRPRVAHHEAAFLGALHRWAGKFSPWVSAEPPDGLVIDLTGCAHLFGGEEALCRQVIEDCSDLGLTARLGIADTLGTAWALARYTEQGIASHRSGDAIDSEAPATRSRAGKRRHWERGGAAPLTVTGPAVAHHIAPIGKSYNALSDLPIAALRLDADTLAQLGRLGLRRVGDLLGQPRAGLARRFGRGLVDRLDQATGSAPEPISPTPPPDRFAVRLSFPDPIGLAGDTEAALARMTDRLCARLETRARGARTLRIEAHRCDHSMQWLTVTAATAHHDPERWLPLLAMKIDEIDAGPGIDMLRLEATGHEPLHQRTRAGHAEAAARGQSRATRGAAMEDLIGRLGARIGMEAITRRHPGQSHIPEKTALTLAAAWSEPAEHWPAPVAPRPLTLWTPEPVTAESGTCPPIRFRWRGRDFRCLNATGPERIAPEWWLDDPNWRSGARDYWQVETDRGDRLWLYYAHGAAISEGWFCHGLFA